MALNGRGFHMYAVFKVPVENKGKADQMLKDDLVSRQSITVRDGPALEIEGKETYVLIEGSEQALKKADELFKDIGKKLEGAEAEKIFNIIKEREAEAEGGMGLLFG